MTPMADPRKPEEAFTVRSLGDVRRLEADLVALGYTDRQIAGLIHFATRGFRAARSNDALSSYRKMLRAVLTRRGVPWPPPSVTKKGSAETPIIVGMVYRRVA